ncbi:MAG TPA: hypothetical protein VJB37_02220 [Patescibacteria group bacterium]|nr:hypothetical protein [Patescibacteria group bacterium]
MKTDPSWGEKYNLKILSQCPLCQGSYEAGKDNVLAERAGVHLVHVTCPHCQNAILAMVSVSRSGLSSVGMVTDLSAADVRRLRARATLSEEEMFSYCQLIHNNKIDFNKQL